MKTRKSEAVRGAAPIRTLGRWIASAIGVLLLTGSSASASLLLSDDFESGTFNPAIWATNGSGALVSDPLSAGHGFVLHFESAGSGGDLYSFLLSYTNPVNLQFDFLQVGTTNSGAYVGTDHVTSGFTGLEQWILNTGGAGTYSNLDLLAADTWHHVNLTFNPYDPLSVGSFALKLEQNTFGSNAYFDNIQITDSAPEPGTLLTLALGLGGLAAARFRRRAAR